MNITADTRIWQVAQTVTSQEAEGSAARPFLFPFSFPYSPQRNSCFPKATFISYRERTATLLMSTMGKQRYIHQLFHLAFTSFPMLIAHLGLLFRQVPISSFGHKSLLIQTTSKCLFVLVTTWYMVQVGRIRVCVCVCIQSVPSSTFLLDYGLLMLDVL